MRQTPAVVVTWYALPPLLLPAASNTFTASMTALAFEQPDKDSNEYKEEAADIWRTPGRVQGRKDNVTAKEMRMAAAQQAGAKRKREEEV